MEIIGIELQTMGIKSYINIDPIRLEIIQSLPELDITLNIPGSMNPDSNTINMLSSEQFKIYLGIRNISNEPLGNFKIESSPEVASVSEADILVLQTLKENLDYNLPVILNAYNMTTDVKITITYSNSEGKINLNNDITLKMIVSEGIEVKECKIEPYFEHVYYKTLKDINPSMSDKGNAFPNRYDDIGHNDSDYCIVRFILYNKSRDKLGICCKAKGANDIKEAEISPKTEILIELMMHRVNEPSQKLLNSLINIEWVSLVNGRRGNLTNFVFSAEDLEFAKSPNVSMSISFENEGSYLRTNALITTKESTKGLILYFYPLRINQDGAKLIPHDLIISGCLAINISDLNNSNTIKFLPIAQAEFVLVVGIGNKNRILCWSYKLWKIAR